MYNKINNKTSTVLNVSVEQLANVFARLVLSRFIQDIEAYFSLKPPNTVSMSVPLKVFFNTAITKKLLQIHKLISISRWRNQVSSCSEL